MSRVKCYAIYDSGNQILSEYANLSQKNFLDHELRSAIGRNKTSERIQFEHSTNGIWYSKHSQYSGHLHIVLLAQETATLSLASSFLSCGIQLESITTSCEKIKFEIAEKIKTYNANSKLDAINNNMADLEGIVKGNVNKIIDNMSDLDSVERKSEMMTSLSLQLQQDSRKVEEKMRRKKLLTRLIIFGGFAFIVIIMAYLLFA